jgi:Flp pilus assembly protein TadG
MRLKHNNKRDGQRGAAALELALASIFLIPLLIGMTQFGYYFYIAMNVLEAQHQGLVAASRVTVNSCSASAGTLAGAQTAASNAIDAYFVANNNLGSILTLSGKTPTCGVSPVNPTWSMTLIADFRPPWGKVMVWDRASPTAGYLRYTARTMYIRGN